MICDEESAPPQKSRLLKLSESQRLNLEEKCFDRRIAAWSNQLAIDAKPVQLFDPSASLPNKVSAMHV